MPEDQNPKTPPKPDPKPAKAAVERHTVEALREKLNPPNWLFNAAKQKQNWPTGQELTEDEFAKALDAAANEPIGTVPPKADDEAADAASK